jgi:hypothetical protein
MTSPSNSAVQNLLPVQAYFNLDGSFNTFIGQGVPFTATISPNQSGLNITSSTINSTTIGLTTPAAGAFTSLTSTSFATTTGTISTQPSGANDIVNLLALQSYAAGISWKNPVTAATTTNITLSGTQTVDTVVLVVGNTVLVKNQTDNTKNGIYQVNAGAWTYATGSTTWAQYVSALVFIEYGGLAGSAWYCSAQPGGTLGVTAMTWSNFSVASTYSAGTGLTLAGYQFSITNTGVAANTYGSATASPVFAVNAQGQITSVTNTTITPALGSITGFGTGVATFLATPTSANLAAAVSDETGTGALVFATSPTFVTPALGTPASGVVTNLTGTASININGSVGATTRYTGDFTSISGNTTTNTTPVLSFNATNTIASFGTTTASSYNQLIIQNKSGTAGASTNYVISNDIGTDSTYYGEFGMNSSVFSASTPADFFSINNAVYFSGHDGDVTIGSGNGFKTYLAWGTAGQSAHVINAAGAIGLSTNLGTTPALSGTSGFGTSGQVLTSQGSAAAPTWTSLSSSAVTTFSAGTTGFTPSSATSGAITLAGTLALANGGTNATSATAALANLMSLTTTVTAAGTTTLTNTSSYYQVFTGTLAQTIVLPVTSTLQAGWSFKFINNSSQTLTVNTSGGNTLTSINAGITLACSCISTGSTGIVDWESGFTDFSQETGIGGTVVLNTIPTLQGITVSTFDAIFSQTTANFTCSAQTTGVTTLGGASQTGTLTFGQSTLSQTTNIQAGATASASTKTINIGTGGLTGSTTAITIGSTFGTTITLNGTVNGTIANATNTAITDDTTTATTCYPTWVTTTTGNLPQKTTSTRFSFVPSTGVLAATTFSGAGTSLTGTAASLSIGGSAGSVANALTAGTGLTASATYNGSAAITFNATGSTINSQTTAYTLVAGDAGKTISITTGGVTVPNAVLAAGNIVTIYNNSASSQTITQGTSVTLQWAGQSTSTTGNRTLGLNGIATIVFITASVAVISGAGLT